MFKSESEKAKGKSKMRQKLYRDKEFESSIYCMVMLDDVQLPN